jgi:hypothetical protein
VELYNFYTSPNIIRVIRSRRMRCVDKKYTWEMKNSYSILVGKPEGKRPLGRPRRVRDDNNRMYLRETAWKDVDRMHLAGGHGPMVGCCEHCNEPLATIRGRKFVAA